MLLFERTEKVHGATMTSLVISESQSLKKRTTSYTEPDVKLSRVKKSHLEREPSPFESVKFRYSPAGPVPNPPSDRILGLPDQDELSFRTDTP